MRIPIGILALVVCAYAADVPDQQQPADPAATANAVKPRWGGWTFSGLADGYWDYNSNSPAMDLNALQNFDLHTGTPRLSLAKFTVDKSDKVIGIHLDVGVGETMRFIHSADPAAIQHKGLRYVEQMYAIVKPNHLHGTEIDFGQFVTSAGAEVIESSSNWNYTRSLLFTYAIPYYHFGLKTTTPVTKELTIGFQLENAWNTVWGNNNLRNVALTMAYTKPRYTWTANYLEGPNHIGTSEGKRNLLDSTVLFTPNSRFNAYVNLDWARDNQPGGSYGQWYGVAFAARGQITKRFAVAGRAEGFNDSRGLATGSAQTLLEATGTGEYKVNDHLLGRFEARRDISNHLFFDQGTGHPLSKAENTITVGIVALLGPMR